MDLRKKHCKSAKHLFVVRVMFLKCQESDSKVTTLGFAIRKYSLVSSWTIWQSKCMYYVGTNLPLFAELSFFLCPISWRMKCLRFSKMCLQSRWQFEVSLSTRVEVPISPPEFLWHPESSTIGLKTSSPSSLLLATLLQCKQGRLGTWGRSDMWK